jgi:hypothetical protein
MNIRTTRGRSLVIGATLAGTLLAGTTAAFAEAGARQASLDQTKVEAGSVIRVHGTGCVVNGEPGAPTAVVGAWEENGTVRSSDAGADGSWTIELTVPGETRPGEHWIHASCLAANGLYRDQSFSYDGMTFTVAGRAGVGRTTSTTAKGTPGRTGTPKAVRVKPRFTG